MVAGGFDVPCFHPIKAWRCEDGGKLAFSETAARSRGVLADLEVPCGQCVGCRLERSRQWAMRCLHEASLHKQNCFITLTYAPEHLPARGSLDYADFQKFMKRFRERVHPVKPRFYMAGEYGEQLERPHFHACIFGYNFPDLKPWKKTGSGSVVCRSGLLESLWPFGFASVGALTFESAAYVARYCMKKVTGNLSEDHYKRIDLETGEVFWLEPEFNHMSLKPGIGADWLDKFTSDVYPLDYVVVNGKEVKPPKYYDKRFAALDAEAWEDVQFARALEAQSHSADNTDARLAVREVVCKAALSSLKRNL